MVIPPPVRPPRITKFLKLYVLKMHFTNKYVSAQVIHAPTATVASSASSQEKALRSSMGSTRSRCCSSCQDWEDTWGAIAAQRSVKLL
ncbi:hypothetical protein SLE2022_081610 [Rubroshorea leprosula]